MNLVLLVLGRIVAWLLLPLVVPYVSWRYLRDVVTGPKLRAEWVSGKDSHWVVTWTYPSHKRKVYKYFPAERSWRTVGGHSVDDYATRERCALAVHDAQEVSRALDAVNGKTD